MTSIDNVRITQKIASWSIRAEVRGRTIYIYPLMWRYIKKNRSDPTKTILAMFSHEQIHVTLRGMRERGATSMFDNLVMHQGNALYVSYDGSARMPAFDEYGSVRYKEYPIDDILAAFDGKNVEAHQLVFLLISGIFDIVGMTTSGLPKSYLPERLMYYWRRSKKLVR